MRFLAFFATVLLPHGAQDPAEELHLINTIIILASLNVIDVFIFCYIFCCFWSASDIPGTPVAPTTDHAIAHGTHLFFLVGVSFRVRCKGHLKLGSLRKLTRLPLAPTHTQLQPPPTPLPPTRGPPRLCTGWVIRSPQFSLSAPPVFVSPTPLSPRDSVRFFADFSFRTSHPPTPTT